MRFGAREYDAETGRWMSRDPILERGGLANMMSYVGGDPNNKRDPTGLFIGPPGREVPKKPNPRPNKPSSPPDCEPDSGLYEKCVAPRGEGRKCIYQCPSGEVERPGDFLSCPSVWWRETLI